MRSSSSRNQRNKRFRVKQVLQLFLLGAVCIWLLYQLKHSYDKKKVIEESSSKAFDRLTEKQPDFLKLGRKGLPNAEDKHSANKTDPKEDGNEEVEDEEQQEIKQKTENHEGKGAGDDEIDEANDQEKEKVNEDGHHEEESANEGEKDQAEGTVLLDEEEHEGDSQESREENYKRDDASSAVLHNIQSTESEFGNGGTRNPDEERVDDKEKENAQSENGAGMQKKDLEGKNGTNETDEGSKANNDTIAEAINSSNDNVSSIVQGENETLSNDNLSMKEASANGNETGAGLSRLKSESTSNSTQSVQHTQSELWTDSTASKESNNETELHGNSTEIASNNMMETQNNSTELDGVANGVPLQNETIKLGLVDEQNATINAENATITMENPKEDHPNSADAGIQQNEKFNASENGNSTQVETASIKRETGDAALDGSDSKRSDSGDATQGESGSSLHNTVTTQVREASTNQSTLPNIDNEVKTSEGEKLWSDRSTAVLHASN